MKIPRDESGESLVKRLSAFGYTITRQSGSHIRLSTAQKGEHHITIPSHDPIKIGTLNSILKDIASHFQISKDELIQTLWG
ncbi:MAG: type II toxin-antitoxin system HicA family toxin [Spirochaetes bacterium]|nr:MAG: type II toxin-antitoxin system HicA family toxin [Spirochaetota bacterium]